MPTITPFISQRSVQLALDAMVSGSQPDQPNPLENLVLVDDFLNDPAMPSMEMAATFALQRLLIDLIGQEFVAQCRIFSLDEPTGYQTHDQVLEAITEKSHLQIPELRGWMLLYYRYVRSDLNITTSDLLEIISVDVRTLRRYQTNAVKRLTKIIAYLERSARQEKQKRYLYSQLPAPINERLWGRDKLLEHVHSIIAHNATTPHVLVTGPDGIGKTSFVQSVAKSLIDEGSIDQLVWITEPNSIDFVRGHLKQALLQVSQISLKEYCLLNRLLVVVDDLNLSSNYTKAENLFQDLNNAILLVTNRVYRFLGASFSHIVLPDLDEDDVASIVKTARMPLQSHPEDLNVFVSDLYKQVGGNPLAIKMAANNLTNINLHQPLFIENKTDLVYRLLLSSYQAVGHNSQMILLMFALLPARPVTLLELSAFWGDWTLADQDMIDLLSCGLLTNYPENDGHILADASRRFVHWLYADSSSVHDQISSLVETLINLPLEVLPLDVIEYILLQEWLDITPYQRRSLAESGINNGLQRGNYLNWSVILAGLLANSPDSDLKLFHAICLRQLADFSRAEALFYEMIEDFGRTGDFYKQGRGMLELGILFRQQGLYEQAITLFERARAMLKPQNEPNILHETDIEIAQTLVDIDDIESLKNIIPDLSMYSSNSTKAMILLSEILLSMKEYSGARLYAERAVKRTHGSNLGRVYAILGRIAAEQKDFESAQHWFDLAISLLEQEGDWYGLARVKSNLAAAFVAQRQFLDDAEVLLLQAQDTQRTLNDRAGIIYTTHNFEILNTLKWIDEP